MSSQARGRPPIGEITASMPSSTNRFFTRSTLRALMRRISAMSSPPRT